MILFHHIFGELKYQTMKYQIVNKIMMINNVVRLAGIEPATPAFGGQYSIH